MFYRKLKYDNIIRNLVLVSLLGFALSSCGLFGHRHDEKPLARAYGNYLYPSDIKGLVPDGSTPEDSSTLVKSYVELWLKKKAVVSKAEFNLTETQKDLETQIEEYRTSLLIYEYEKLMVAQSLDTVVSESQISSYFHQYSQNFLLQDPIIKGIYFRMLKSSPKLREFRELAHSTGDLAYKRLVDMGAQQADYTESFEESWIAFNSLMQKMPGSVKDPEEFLLHYKYLEADDEHYYHFVKITDFKLPGETAPLEFVKQDIRDILLNKRKINFLKELEESIYNEAVIQNEVEVYEN
jgi:hypothetical protein